MVGGSVDLCDMDGVTPTIAPPLATSTIPSGAPKNTYRVDADVYATGTGFTPGTNVDSYVVPDWNDGNPIPADATCAVETRSIVNGAIAPVLVWHAPHDNRFTPSAG